MQHPGRPPDLFQEVFNQSISKEEEFCYSFILFLRRISQQIDPSNFFHEKVSLRALFSSFYNFEFFYKIKSNLSCLTGQPPTTNEIIFSCIHLEKSTIFKNFSKKSLMEGAKFQSALIRGLPHFKTPRRSFFMDSAPINNMGFNSLFSITNEQ
jgi:hypothetical protein